MMVAGKADDVLKLIQQRKSTRASFDPHRSVDKEDLGQIIEAARWAPTPHNMQNFEIIVVDDRELLRRIGSIRSPVSESFVRENHSQLSFSRRELLHKKVGILGAYFPPAWRDPTRFGEALREERGSSLNDTIDGSPAVLIVIYDPRKRAPASEGDFLGILGLGCVMENMWLTAQALKIGFQIMSVFGGESVEKEVKRVLSVPTRMKIAYAIRLGYPVHSSDRYLRVRRDVEGIAHHNRYGDKGLARGNKILR
jgi:nitroreductase